jgi:hypothetical protein
MTDPANSATPQRADSDAEVNGEHATTASTASVNEEKTPTFHPQNAHEVAAKIKKEASDERGLLGKTKKALEEIDRQVAGEYEQREDHAASEQGVREERIG